MIPRGKHELFLLIHNLKLSLGVRRVFRLNGHPSLQQLAYDSFIPFHNCHRLGYAACRSAGSTLKLLSW